MKRLLNYFRVKKINKLFRSKSCQLAFFQKIVIEEKYYNLVQKIKGEKNRQCIQKFYETVNIVKNHNDQIQKIKEDFDKHIKDDSIENILNNLDRYPLEKLTSINILALTVNNYKIPDSFQGKKQYLNYSQRIGEIIDSYQDIVIQYNLIKDYNEFSLDDYDYIDKEKKEKITKELEKIIIKISHYGEKFYKTPVVDDRIFEIHNAKFIERHIHDSVFDDVNGLELDFDQRKAILCETKSNLVVAGAGAGKTLTICGKVKYLLDNKYCAPDDILLLSYSKASAEDLAQKVQKVNNDIKVKTFHALGLEILNCYRGTKNTVEEQFTSIIRKYFEEELLKDNDAMKEALEFYGTFLQGHEEVTKQYESDGELFEDLKKKDYRTLKDRLKELNEEKSFETVKKETVKSYEELVIANFLFINGVKYQYEKAYKFDTSTPDKRQYTPDFYLSDYDIYIEHYGIDRNYHTPQYTKEKEQEYIKGIEWKRATHIQYNTKCIETYSYEFSEGTIFVNLLQKLADNGVKCNPLDDKQIADALKTVFHGQEFLSLLNLIVTFLNLYKAKYSDESGFKELEKKNLYSEYENERAKRFIKICRKAFLYYRSELKQQQKIDFDDMILQVINIIGDIYGYRYKYIIVDEFQDISQSRLKFLKKLIEHGNSKLFAVGDDWQSIYRFAGCDVNIFLNFCNLFEDAKINYITTTHRNSAELQAVVEPFITANPEQFKKHIVSDIHQDKPVRIVYYNRDKTEAFMKALDEIYKINHAANVLVLGRNRHDITHITKKDMGFEKFVKGLPDKFNNFKMEYKTVHQSKGIESDFVILISGDDAYNGFPNKMEDDRLIDLILGERSRFLYAEERRLFYVALTRTRSIVYILSNKKEPSVFVEEIEQTVEVENLIGQENKKEVSCPVCKSGRLVLRHSTGNKTFYGCTNFPYCKYVIDDLAAVAKNNRCPVCGDFLVIRNGINGKFIGCNNYPRCTFTRNLIKTTYMNDKK